MLAARVPSLGWGQGGKTFQEMALPGSVTVGGQIGLREPGPRGTPGWGSGGLQQTGKPQPAGPPEARGLGWTGWDSPVFPTTHSPMPLRSARLAPGALDTGQHETALHLKGPVGRERTGGGGER